MSLLPALSQALLGYLYASQWIRFLTATERIYVQDLLIILILHIVVVLAVYAAWVYRQHEIDFGGKRLSRRNSICPTSTKMRPPDIRNWKSNQQQVLAKSELHPSNFATCELLNDVKKVDHDKKVKNERFRRQSLQKPRASVLDMDHIYLTYSQYLWAFTFVGPFSYFLWKKGVFFLKLRVMLNKMGIIKMKPVDYEALVGKMVLEQSQAIHYFARTAKDSELGNIAGFFFADFPYVNEHGEMKTADLLAVDICLDTKKMVKCKLDDKQLNASEALILLWYNTISAQHVKLHSYGNWGVNIDEEARRVNEFLHTNSLVTVIYNYFGFTSFPRFFDAWKKAGLLSKDWDPQAFTDTVKHGVRENIWQHAHITQLVPYSDFVTFITKTRAIFHTEFLKHKHLFPGINGEGLFAGTILHSLDHALMDWNLEDPLWLDVDHPKWGKMAELGRIVKVGFVPEVPGYYFHHKFKGSGHPFYEAVYEKAAKINKKMADHMDTCICR